MSLMQMVSKGRDTRPPRIMVYGQEGIGKSTFATSAPNAIAIQTEDGLSEIDVSKLPLCRNLETVMEQLKAIRDDEHSFETVVVDSLDWLERLVWDRVCADYGVKSIEKADGGFGKGYVHALTYWRKFVEMLQEIREKRGMAVILVAHSKVERYEDPESSGYDRYTPRLHKAACSLICEWVDAILFAKARTRVDAENKKATAIGADGGERILRAIGGPGCIAKNRYGIPQEIPLSWTAFMEALKAGVSR